MMTWWQAAEIIVAGIIAGYFLGYAAAGDNARRRRGVRIEPAVLTRFAGARFTGASVAGDYCPLTLIEQAQHTIRQLREEPPDPQTCDLCVWRRACGGEGFAAARSDAGADR